MIKLICERNPFYPIQKWSDIEKALFEKANVNTSEENHEEEENAGGTQESEVDDSQPKTSAFAVV